MAGANFDADNMLAVFRVAFEDAVEIDIPDVAKFRNAVTGNKTDRSYVEECLDPLSGRLDHLFA